MKPGSDWVFLALAIASEVSATSALKAAQGFTLPLPSIVVVIGYAASFYFLSLTLRTIPLGVAYAIWAGAGVSLLSLIGWIVYSQKINGPSAAGICLIVAGVLVIRLFGTASE